MNYSSKSLSIKSWAEEERPREKLLHKGSHSLTLAELMAIILGSGNAQKNAVELAREMVECFEGKLSQLSKATVSDFLKFKGVGPAKAIALVAALELAKRRLLEKSEDIASITSSQEAYAYIIPHFLDQKVEAFWVAFLNRANKPIGCEKLSMGGIHGTVVDHRILFKKALDKYATSILLFHNHPSGQLKPSAQDDRITKQIQDAGLLLDIRILDHLIVSDKSYYSYADAGKLS
jgi:DNA repair protein RadC